MIISSFCLIFYTLFAGFLAYKMTTFSPTLQIFDNKVYNSIQKHHRYHCLEKCKETVSKQYPKKCTFLQKSTFLDNIYIRISLSLLIYLDDFISSISFCLFLLFNDVITALLLICLLSVVFNFMYKSPNRFINLLSSFMFFEE